MRTTSPAISSPGMSVTPGGGGYPPRRCNTSGRLTPAAATLISTSPGPGAGIGREVGRSASGGPGLAISIAIISAGISLIIGDYRASESRECRNGLPPCRTRSRTWAAVEPRASAHASPGPSQRLEPFQVRAALELRMQGEHLILPPIFRELQ